MAKLPEDLIEFLRKMSPLLKGWKSDEIINICSKQISVAKKRTSISLPVLVASYVLRAAAYDMKLKPGVALNDLHKSIELDPLSTSQYISCYMASHAKSEKTYTAITQLAGRVSKIQRALIYDPYKNVPIVAHYTGLHVLENLVHTKQFRLYNADYMNDSEEGGVFLKIISKMSKHNIQNSIYSKDDDSSSAYIGSFVRLSEDEYERKNGKLFLWRTYGKHAGDDGAGACIHFDASKFPAPLPVLFGQMDLTGFDQPNCIYNVVYANQIDSGEQDRNEPEKYQARKVLHANLLKLAAMLKDIVENEWGEEKDNIYKITRELLDHIRFLFKAAHYQEEQELRMVQSRYTPDNVKIDMSRYPPRFFVEAGNIPLDSVVLGPMTQGCFEWKHWLKKENRDLNVYKSTIPFRQHNQ